MAFSINEELIRKAEENVKRIINLYDYMTYNEFLKELDIDDRYFKGEGLNYGFIVGDDKEEAFKKILPWALAELLKHGH